MNLSSQTTLIFVIYYKPTTMVLEEKRVLKNISGWLTVYSDGSVDRSWTGPPEFKFMADPVPPSVEYVDGVATRDIVIDSASGLAVRVYLPEEKIGEEKELLPVMVHFPGGGFCISEANWFMYHAFYSRVVKAAGAACVSVYLRRAPEHRLPAAIDDGLDVIHWLRSLARGDPNSSDDSRWLTVRADFTRVFLVGDSSGGSLVHLVAAEAGNEPDWSPLRLAGGLSIHPGFVRSTRSRSELELPESPFLTLAMLDGFLGLALPEGATKDHPYTCPMGAAAPAFEKLNLPPMMVVVAENDLIKDTEMEYVEAMKAAGKEVELVVNAGVGHSFYLNTLAVAGDLHTAAETTALIDAISGFIDRHGKK